MLLVRHGDENPPEPAKNKTTVIHSSHWKELEEDAVPYLDYMQYIDVKEIESGKLNTKRLSREAFFSRKEAAQVTKRGFMQNLKLGQFLAKRYASLIPHVAHTNQVYVRSSRSDRAVQSVAALLTGLLPPMLNSTSRITLRYFNKMYHEVMMGIGKNHDVCSTIVQNSKTQQQMMRDKNKDISNAVSASQTAYCNNEPLFCPTIEGSVRCLTPNTLAVLKSMNDRTMCQLFAGSMGGLRASELKAGPFMQDLKRHLKRAIEITPSSVSPERIVVYGGHSSILQLALVGLGVYRHICANPPFGARVTFEVWDRNIPGVTPVHKKTSIPRQLKGVDRKHIFRRFVRVLYDGKDITHLIPSCVMKAEPDEITWFDKRKLKEDGEGNHLLCPLDRLFLHFDSGPKSQYDYLPEDCQKVFKKNYAHYNTQYAKDV
jgi:hypothetical protein